MGPLRPPVVPRRPCPVPGCPNEAANGHALCQPCWRLVPASTQDVEMAAFRAWCRNVVPEEAYKDALWIAIRSVQRAHRSGHAPAPRTGRPGEPVVGRILR